MSFQRTILCSSDKSSQCEHTLTITDENSDTSEDLDVYKFVFNLRFGESPEPSYPPNSRKMFTRNIHSVLLKTGFLNRTL